jgi:hypothetical protein
MSFGCACTINAIWEPRAETPEALARRFLNLTARLATIDPVFAHWYIWTSETTEVPLDLEPAVLAEKIAQTADLDVHGAPVPELGYRYIATNNKTDGVPSRDFTLIMRAGAFWRSSKKYQNSTALNLLYGIVPDPDIVSYPIIKQAVLALSECCDALWCSAYSSELVNLWQNKRGPYCEIAWISYCAPRIAQTISPPQRAVVERRPDGGLLMAATTETFDIADPAHLTVAQDIAAAVAFLGNAPGPPEDEDS